MPQKGQDNSLSLTSPTMHARETDDQCILHLAGDWTIETLADADHLVIAQPEPHQACRTINLAQLGNLDTSGAWVIVRLFRKLDIAFEHAQDVQDDHRTLFEAVWETNRAKPKLEKAPGIFISAFDKTGRDMVEVYQDVKILAHLAGGVIYGLWQALFDIRKLRFTSIVHHIEQTGMKAVPIVAMMSFLVGAIVAQQGAFQLGKFGADPFVIDLVGILVLREVGILLTAILVAGRSGSAFTAEIGSMKMREEVDALRVIGLDVIQVLITPRVIALIIALPLLGLVADVAALFGGGMLLWAYSDINPASYINWLREAVALNTFFVGVIKAPFMALIIALISCAEGLQVEGSAESLGRRTTAAVVKSIFLVVLVDGIFAIYFAAIGY